MRHINLLQPTFDEQTKKELIEVLDSGWVMFGAKTLEFEKKFAKYVHAPYAIATNSCTSALDLALKVHGIKDGELITTPMTFVSDAIVGEWNGMDVTFADIDENLCLDPESLHLSENTKAIIAVDSHGRIADIKGIRQKCKEAGIHPLIIEDAAHAMYAQPAGEDADITVWSFQAVKTMPIFDGGMITVRDESIYNKLRKMTWLGVEKLTYERISGARYSWDYDIKTGDGIKAYMTDVQAVIGLGQLRRLDTMLEKRRRTQKIYNEAFEGQPWFKAPPYSHTVQYYTPQWHQRDMLSEFLAEWGIHTSVHFKPLSEMTYWKKAVKRSLPNTDRVWRNLLSLPVHDALTPIEQRYIIEKVFDFYTDTTTHA